MAECYSLSNRGVFRRRGNRAGACRGWGLCHGKGRITSDPGSAGDAVLHLTFHKDKNRRYFFFFRKKKTKKKLPPCLQSFCSGKGKGSASVPSGKGEGICATRAILGGGEKGGVRFNQKVHQSKRGVSNPALSRKGKERGNWLCLSR